MKLTLKIYIILSIAVIAFQLAGIDPIENMLKPLLMPCLMIGFGFEKKWKLKALDYSFLAALFFSFLGDVFLMPLFNIFMAGLVSFLIAHLFFVTIFLKEKQKPLSFNTNKKGLLFLGITLNIVLLSLIYYKMIPQGSSMILLLAIGIYAIILLLVFISALLRQEIPKPAYIYLLLGSATFLLSDSFLAINKFVITLPYSPLWVMTTYTLAQALLTIGFLKRSE